MLPNLCPLHSNSDISSGFGEFLMGVARLVIRTVCVHSTRIDELAFSASEALELKSCSIVDMLRSPEHSGTVSRANPSTQARSPDPLS